MARYDVGLEILYVLPVALATLQVGRWAGIAMAAASAATWLGVNLVIGTPTAFWVLPYWNSLVRLIFFILIVALVHAWHTERGFARHDFLTGVANRQAFVERAEHELARSHRYRHPFTVAYLDCDGFKRINDTLGHRTGDAVLRLLAQTLSRTLRATDVVARLGGDEFALLLPETGAVGVPALLARVQAAVAAAMQGRGWPTTISIGAVTFATFPESVELLLDQADRLMYAVKRLQTSGAVKHAVYDAPTVPIGRPQRSA